MKSLLYLATGIGVAMMAVSCVKEEQHSKKKVDVSTAKANFKYINEVIVTDGKSADIPIDSNTAIVHVNGDTLFPRWYRKKLVEAGDAGARWTGDYGANGAIITSVGNIDNPPVKAATGYFEDSLFYTVSPVWKIGDLFLYKDDVPFRYIGTKYQGTFEGSIAITAEGGVGYQFELDTYEDDGVTPKAVVTDYWYVYGWQTVSGMGTAYGTDMKFCDIDGNGVTDLVGMTSNRTSGSVNGFYYKLFMNINPITGAPATTTTAQVNLMNQKSTPYSPCGGAVAVANIDQDNNDRQDLLICTYTSLGTGDNYNWRYRIAWNVNNAGVAESYSDIFTIPGVGNIDIKEIGATIADVDNDGDKDIVLSATHSSTSSFDYIIGKNLTTTGSATWDGVVHTISLNSTYGVLGAGIDIAKVNTNDPSAPMSMFISRYNFNGSQVMVVPIVAATGNPYSTSPYFYNHPTINGANSVTGGGVSVKDIDHDNLLDVITSIYYNGNFYYYIDYGMMKSSTQYGNIQYKRGLGTANVK